MDSTAFARISRKKALKDLAAFNISWRLFFLIFLLSLSVLGIAYAAEGAATAIISRFFPTLSQGMTYAVPLCVTLLCIWFLLAPLWRGVCALLLHRFLFGETDFGLVFYFFSHRKRYAFSLRKSLRAFVRLTLLFLLTAVGAGLGTAVGNWLLLSGQPAVALLVGMLSLAFIILLCLVFSMWGADSFLMDAAFLSSPLLSYRQLQALSARKMKRGRRALYRLNFSFLPLWILSVVLLGVPLVFFIPYYITARSRLAAVLIRN